MNDQAEPVAADDTTTTEEKKSPLMRQLLMITLLLVLLGALYFDRQVARPASQAKADALVAAANERLGSEMAQLTPDEVAEVLERQAADVEETDDYVLETYRWAAGLPWRSYDVNVVYIKSKDSPRYYSSFYNQEPEEQLLPGNTKEPEATDPLPDANDPQGAPVAPGPGPEPEPEPEPDPAPGADEPSEPEPAPESPAP